ncbi:MATH and LRR domain-containing protein PFE0570w-like isoform X2 [Apis dorsata]|uniref:MATH and LRR domain-containing protein PFE0570w-like isoform X2 n=1 Tax=Apis dorsata TaxID=7462 RepID=UPI00129397D9|nr:MATH and LRR domain-containing protein PFE0570w-like isoform X2 [Apis dorsata]
MAKRKSLNRRSSRYSSTILNSNSDISSDEYTTTDWWKNLEDNTIRPSIASNILNQTSRQLDSNSQIKTSQVTDGWWKALEVTNISNSSKVNENIVTKESINNVLTSESEEESKIVKRKYFLRSKIRRSEDNIFLHALNNSITTSEFTQKTGKESSINKSALSNKIDLNAEQSNEIQVSNLSDSLNTNDILKMKPNIFKKNNKNQNNNIFVNVLKKNQLETPLKRKSSKISSDNEDRAQTSTEYLVPIVTETSESNEILQNQISLSFNNEHNFSHFPIPKAQSTILEGTSSFIHNNNKESNNSDTNSEILKPKSKLLTRHYKNVKENLFENIFEKQETINKISENTVADDAERILNSSEISEAKTDKSITSNNITSDTNHDLSKVRKSKSKFLKKLRKNQKRNLFQDIFEKNDDTLSTLKHSLHLSEEENLYSSTQDKNKRIVNRQENELIDFHLRMSDEDDNTNVINISAKPIQSKQSIDKSKTKNIEDIPKRKSKNLHNSEREIEDIAKNKNLNNIKKKLSLVKKAKIDSSENKNIRRSSRLHKLHNPSISPSVSRIEQEEVKNTTQRISKTLNKIQEVDKIGENIIEDGEDTTKSNNPNKLQKKSMDTYSKRQSKIFHESDLSNTSEIELEEIEKKSIKITNVNASFLLDNEKQKIEKNHDKSLNKSTDLISSVIGTYVEDNNISKKQGNDFSNKLQKESVDTYSKTQNKIFDESDLSTTFEIESDEFEKKSTKKTSIANMSSLSDNEKQTIEKNRNNEESDKSKNLMSSVIKKHIEDRNISKEQKSNRLSKLQNESVDTYLKRQSKIFNESNLPITSESKEIENKSKRESIANASFLFDNKKQKVGENDKVENKTTNFISTVTGSRIDKDSNVSKGQRSIRNFLTPNDALPASQILCDEEKVKEIRRELEKVKEKEMASMGTNKVKFEEKSFFQGRKKEFGRGKKLQTLQKRDRSTKQIHRAFLVNGQKYKPPRLPRPQPWITDRLYKYLWKYMEPRFKLETRLVSEKFIHQLSNVTKFIMKCKSYLDYENELYALMKEMARLGIISTRNDFYHFCQDFFLYELRVKIVPMLLPGNKKNIPYDANKLNEPLLDS